MSTQAVPARAARLFAVWSKLSDAPMTEDQLEQMILRQLDRVGAEADAAALTALLIGAEAVIAIRTDDGSVRYRRAQTFPTHPPTGPGTPSWDRHLAEASAREQEQHDKVAADLARRAPQNLQREELDQHIRSIVRDLVPTLVHEHLHEHMREVERQAEMRGRVRERFAKRQTQEDSA